MDLEATVAFVNGQPVHLWLARNSDGAVLEVLVQRSRDRRLALRDLRRLLAERAFTGAAAAGRETTRLPSRNTSSPAGSTIPSKRRSRAPQGCTVALA